MPNDHPAYPTANTLRREAYAINLEIAAADVNREIRHILTEARAKIEALDLTQPSMAYGYDLIDIPAHIGDITPLDNTAERKRLQAWAAERAAEVV